MWTKYYLNGQPARLNPVTIDARTLSTTYNVLDNRNGANQFWLRSGFQCDFATVSSSSPSSTPMMRKRHWFNNEINSTTIRPSANFGQVYRERLSVDHDQRQIGNVTDLTVNSNLGGMENQFVTTFSAYSQRLNVVQDDFFNNDYVDLVNPDRGIYGTQQTKNFYTRLNNVALAFEDRLKVTPTVALLGGIRVEEIDLAPYRVRRQRDCCAAPRATRSKTFTPVTGRAGITSGMPCPA